MSSSEVKIGLGKLGLAQNEIEVYLYLRTCTQRDIHSISESTKIPRSTIYQILKNLSSKALVTEIIAQNRKLYSANSLRTLKHQLVDEYSEIAKSIKSVDSLDSHIGDLSLKELGELEIRKYEGKTSVRQLFWNTLSAQDTIYVYSYFGRSKFVGLTFYKNFVRESRNRGFKEKVLINPSQRVFDMIIKDNGSAQARTKMEDIRCVDKSEVDIQGEIFIYDNVFATVYLDHEQITGFEIVSQQFADTNRSIFDSYWQRAKKLTFYISP